MSMSPARRKFERDEKRAQAATNAILIGIAVFAVIGGVTVMWGAWRLVASMVGP